MDLSAALETIWMLVRRLNRYVEEQAPWKQAKEAAAEGAAGAAAAALDATLWDLAEGLRLLSVMLHPFIPETAQQISARLGLGSAGAETFAPRAAGGAQVGAGIEQVAGPSWDQARWGLLPEGSSVVAGSALFPRIED
jgi:methionyl-tRNA synthetase